MGSASDKFFYPEESNISNSTNFIYYNGSGEFDYYVEYNATYYSDAVYNFGYDDFFDTSILTNVQFGLIQLFLSLLLIGFQFFILIVSFFNTILKNVFRLFIERNFLVIICLLK